MTESAITPLQYSSEYFYGLSLIIGAVVNWVLAGLLVFDPENDVYEDVNRYLRSRYLTAFALTIFGLGFFFHWLFCPRINYPLAASALSLAYFHIGGTLFSISHTSLVDRNYLNTRIVIRDVCVLIIGLALYGGSILADSHVLLHLGFGIFFLHIGYLTWSFYKHFHHTYTILGSYAEYLPNYSDRDVRWMFFSCHLIILFGIGSIVITLIFPTDTLPFTILMIVGIGVFSYIYKALDNYSAYVMKVEQRMIEAEQYLATEKGKQNFEEYILNHKKKSSFKRFALLSGFFKQW